MPKGALAKNWIQSAYAGLKQGGYEPHKATMSQNLTRHVTRTG
jgi:hypothetical protein